MPAAVLAALIRVAHPSWWVVTAVVVVVVIWCVVRFADRLAVAVERVMLACDRRAARKMALTAVSPGDRHHALAVLAQLNAQTAAIPAVPRSRRRGKRSNDDRPDAVTASATDR